MPFDPHHLELALLRHVHDGHLAGGVANEKPRRCVVPQHARQLDVLGFFDGANALGK